MQQFLVVATIVLATTIEAFAPFSPPRPSFVGPGAVIRNKFPLKASKSSGDAADDDEDGPTLQRILSDDEGVPIPFVEMDGSNFIECFADSYTTVKGVEYTIGVPCDYAVALCYFDEQEQLIPVELDDEMMDDVFPIASSIVEEEFGEELYLQRTPQTLTLVGELEDDDDEEDNDDDDDDMEDGEEEVEILLSFEHRGKEFNLVRLLDPVLLVGKADPDNEGRRILLSLEESEAIMPVLEDMFLEFHEERDLSV